MPDELAAEVMKGLWAHSPPEEPAGAGPHELMTHLEMVGELAKLLGEPAGLGEWAERAGERHDLGKARARFQAYLRGRCGSVSHKLAGAALSLERGQGLEGMATALAIAGHHSGLPAKIDLGKLAELGKEELREGLAAGLQVPARAAAGVPERLAARLRALDREDLVAAQELVVRFLFSALVDADFRDTAAFFDPPADP